MMMARGDRALAYKVPKTARRWPSGSTAHPPDVHKLLGAHIVSVDNEAAVVLVQQAAKLCIVLREALACSG